MNTRWVRRVVRVIAAAVVLLPLLVSPVASASPPEAAPARIEAHLLEQLANQDKTTFWVILRQQADLSLAVSVQGWDARGQLVAERLQAVAASSQAGLLDLLQKRGVDYHPFWILNTIRVTAGTDVLNEIAVRPEVAEILADRTYQIPDPLPGKEEVTIETIEWNIDRIGAPLVWSTFGDRGEGIVVANIDTGVMYNHTALVNQYRGHRPDGSFDHNYNWFDPSSVCGSPSLAPCDNNGHGTHTMGTMVGDDGGTNQVGVAPGGSRPRAARAAPARCRPCWLPVSGCWLPPT